MMNINKLIAIIVYGFFLSAQNSFAQTNPLTEYAKFKEILNKKYGLEYNFDYSIMLQRGSPSGQYNAVQSYFSPSITWTNFSNRYGTGSLNFSYYSVYYGNHNAVNIQNRTGMATPINDFDDKTQEFASLYYTYQLPSEYNWIALTAGQFGLSMFDGTDYNNNQQENFINYSLSQNASAGYTGAGIGAYIQLTPNNWELIFGAQDATNIDATSIRVNRLNENHYTTFAYIGYNPTINKLGKGQYSIMFYNQPNVKEQPQTINGWSLNIQQNIGEKLSLFGRINGVSGNMITISNSYVVGAVYNNPLNRNELDQIGLAYAYNKIDSEAVENTILHKAEQVIETYYAFGISKWATITPDFQFYINPVLNSKTDYGTATTLRLTVFF